MVLGETVHYLEQSGDSEQVLASCDASYGSGGAGSDSCSI